MYLVNTQDGEAATLCLKVDVTEEGVWTWSGLWRGATVTNLVPGVIFTGGFFMMGVRTWEVIKVNKVTAKFRDTNDGTEYTARIDR